MDIFSETPADLQSDWARSLPREAFQEIILILRGALPPPVADDPAAEARRDKAAMAGVAALQPANAAEGRLAAQFVAADAWALDCLRLAGERRREPEIARKCRAQAMGLMRESKSSLRLLLRLQAARRAVEASGPAAAQAAWVEHGVMGMMAEALAVAPAVPVAPVALDEPHWVAATAGPEAGSGVEGRIFGLAARNATESRNSRSETEAGFRLPIHAAPDVTDEQKCYARALHPTTG